ILTVAAIALFLYDSIITTGEEIRCFWGRRVTGAAILYWLIKYMTMLDLVWELAAGSGKISSKQAYSRRIYSPSCSASVRGETAVDFSLPLIPAAFTGIRVYALRRSYLLGSITFVLSSVSAGVNFVHFWFGLTGENLFPAGCTGIDGESIDLVKKSVLPYIIIVARSCLIAADCIAIGATWFTLARPGEIGHIRSIKGSVSHILLVDGTIYFLILAILNCVHLALTLLSVPRYFVTMNRQLLTLCSLTSGLTSILVSRFLLHIQSASLRTVGSMPSSQVSSIELDRSLFMERAVGSLGTCIAADDYLGQDEHSTLGEDEER
ncbi:hypothetical protein BD310DRAFT_832199, partial [Dichomitus squalens]